MNNAGVSLIAALLALQARATPAGPRAEARIDHLILGAADLDRATESFAAKTGVRPVYGGKHPIGTHNALASLGDGTYLEIIALQPGITTPPPSFSALKDVVDLTPIDWAVAANDADALRLRLTAAGFALAPASAGSRVTPAGATLRWQTFGLTENVAAAPFFIVWSPGTPHPSTTSPAGCTLRRWTVAGPAPERLGKLRSELSLQVDVTSASSPGLRLELTCPKGPVTFPPAK